ncbi:hypothetical protein YC2023_112342 [Brassica napus]
MDYKLAMRLTLTLFLFHANLLLSENIGLAKIDAARMVSARTRSWFLQAWALEIQGKHSESVAELSKIYGNDGKRAGETHEAGREIVSNENLFLKTSIEVESTFPRLEERMLGPHNVSVNEDLREAAKQVEVLASVQTYVLVFVTMYGRINHSHSIEFHPELLEQFAIGGKEADALEKSKISSSGGSSLHQYRDYYQIF